MSKVRVKKLEMIIHDFFRFIGGGEKVVLTLAREWNMPIVAGDVAKECALYLKRQKIDIRDLTISKRAPFYLNFSQILKYMWGFKNINITSRPDVVFFSGDFAPLAAPFFSYSKKIYYCHTPPRILFDLREFLSTRLNFNFVKQTIFKVVLKIFEHEYKKAIFMQDVVIVNSRNVQKRLKKYLEIDADVVYPPCDVQDFCCLGQEDYYLSTARLIPAKRVDLIVRAFLKMPDKNLIVISTGEELVNLKKMARSVPNIKFLGWVSEQRYRELLGKCIATIYIPINEDFGISPVESMAAGKPVIGVAEGGLLETIEHKKTGILIPPDPTEEDLIEAVKFLGPKRALNMKMACVKRARIFSKERFINQIKEIVYGC